jgi:transcriptional regulator GlxA family with amidase domain
LITSGDARPAVFDILVQDGFVLTEFACVVDILRIANRVGPRPLFRWNVVSARGGLCHSGSAAMVDTDAVPARPKADYLFALGNREAVKIGPALGRAITQYRTRGARVFLLAEAAAWFIRNGGDPAAGLHTTHWENRQLLSETAADVVAGLELASQSDGIVTCAGMGATADVMLSLLADHMSQSAVRTVADIMLHDQIREMTTRQPFGGQIRGATGDPVLDHCIALMQTHVEDPLAIGQICTLVGASARSIERKFKSHLGTTPNGFYREMRLNKASNLLQNTTLSIREIGLACGFSSGFAVLYKALFGISPSAARRKTNDFFANPAVP